MTNISRIWRTIRIGMKEMMIMNHFRDICSQNLAAIKMISAFCQAFLEKGPTRTR